LRVAPVVELVVSSAVERVELDRVVSSVSSRAARQARHSQNAWARSTRRTCRVVSRRDVTSQVEFGLFSREST